jgi:hypothetical protein
MKPLLKVLKIEFKTVFLCLLLGCSLLSASALKKVRGYRRNQLKNEPHMSRQRNLSKDDLLDTFRQRSLKGAYSLSAAPTTVDSATANNKKEKEAEVEENELINRGFRKRCHDGAITNH